MNPGCVPTKPSPPIRGARGGASACGKVMDYNGTGKWSASRLLRKVGLGELWPVVDAEVDRENPYVMRHYEYLSRYARGASGTR